MLPIHASCMMHAFCACCRHVSAARDVCRATGAGISVQSGRVPQPQLAGSAGIWVGTQGGHPRTANQVRGRCQGRRTRLVLH